MQDYLIVGLGLAGMSFCEQLEKNGRTYSVISDTSQISSVVAGGLYNPVILKRFTLAWRAKEQLELAVPFYTSLEEKLKVKVNHKLPVLRRFSSVEEQNMWFEATDKTGLNSFLTSIIHENTNPSIAADFGYGEVLHTGRIDTALLLETYAAHLLANNKLIKESFDHSALEVSTNGISYKTIKAKYVIFTEGFGLKKNPFFNYLPLTSTKGEYLTIRAPKLKEQRAIKSSIFLIPWGDDLYRVGATYKWKDITNLPTEASRVELIEKLDALVNCEYEIIEQVAGIRPTVTDRRPLLGKHPEYENLFVLNGFGSRGVLIAPFASENLFNYIEHNKALPSEIDIARFSKKYIKK